MSAMLMPSIVCGGGVGGGVGGGGSGSERQDLQLQAQLLPGVGVAAQGTGCSSDRLLPAQSAQPAAAAAAAAAATAAATAATKRCHYEMFDAGTAGKRPCQYFNIESLISRSQFPASATGVGTAAVQAPAACYNNSVPQSTEMVYQTAQPNEFKPAAAAMLPTSWPGQSPAGQLPGRAFDMMADGRGNSSNGGSGGGNCGNTGGAVDAQAPLAHVTQQVIPLAYTGNVKPYSSTPWVQPSWPAQQTTLAESSPGPSQAATAAPSMRYPDNVNVLMWHPMTAMPSHMEPYAANSAGGTRPQAANVMSHTSPPVQAATNPYYKPPAPFWFPGNSDFGMPPPTAAPPSLDLRYAYPAAALTFHGRTARLVSPMYRPQISESHRPVTCRLHNADLWQVFNRHTTEMVITKAGRRMFPIIEAKLEGLYPERSYAVVVDIVPADQYHWKFTGTEWRIGGPRCEPPMPSRLYLHQESPSSGLHWMQDVLNFGKLKITNDKGTPGHEIVLDSLHKYVVRLHVACFHQSNDYAEVVHTCVFSETSFIAVTAYQNNQMTQLKIEHNPFAKGFREGSSGRPSARRLRNKSDEKNSEDGAGKSSNSSDEGGNGRVDDTTRSWNPLQPGTDMDNDTAGETQSSVDSV